MSKRSYWVFTCLAFTGLWLFVSVFLWILVFPVLMVPVSLLMILLPVGVEDKPPAVAPNWSDHDRR